MTFFLSDKCINQGCTHHECEYIEFIEHLLGETVLNFRCQDKKTEYLAIKGERPKEIDLVLETSSFTWAVEAKKVVLGWKEEEENIHRLIRMVSEKMGETEVTAFVKIKKGLQAAWDELVSFIENYLSDERNTEFHHKHIDIRIVKGSKGKIGKLFASDSDLESWYSNRTPNAFSVPSIIYASNNEKQHFIVDFNTPMPIEGYYQIGREIVDKVNTKIAKDIFKFKSYDQYKKMFFFHVELPFHLREFYEMEHPESDRLKTLVFRDIERALEHELTIPRSITVVIMLTLETHEEKLDCYFWSMNG